MADELKLEIQPLLTEFMNNVQEFDLPFPGADNADVNQDRLARLYRFRWRLKELVADGVGHAPCAPASGLNQFLSVLGVAEDSGGSPKGEVFQSSGKPLVAANRRFEHVRQRRHVAVNGYNV